jgi:imidazolonepropionase-like amidohydrolase
MSKPTVFHAEWLADPLVDQAIGDAALLVVEGQVLAAGRAADIGVPDGAQRVNLGPVSIVPGLIDAHAHLMLDGSADPLSRLTQDDDGLLLYRMADNARKALAGGVTTLRDCGCRPGLSLTYRQAVTEGLISGPEAVVCDRVLTITGGHLYFVGFEADTPEQLRVAVRRQAKAGVDFIKIMGSGGRITPSRANLRRVPQYGLEELRTVVEESHRLGLRVAIHAHPMRAIELATAAGVDSIEHCLWLDDSDGVRFRPDVADRMAEKGIFVVPTLGRSYHPPGSGNPPDPSLPPLEETLALFEKMRKSGVRFVAGGDTGASHTPFGEFVWNLELMEQFGMSSREALATGTSLAAECIGRCDLGALSPGRKADFLAVRGEPLSDIRALWEIDRVYKAGRLVWRKDAENNPIEPAHFKQPTPSRGR